MLNSISCLYHQSSVNIILGNIISNKINENPLILVDFQRLYVKNCENILIHIIYYTILKGVLEGFTSKLYASMM